MSNAAKVLLVDSHWECRVGLESAIKAGGFPLELIEHSNCDIGAVAAAERSQPDVIMIEIDLPSQLETLSMLASAIPEARILAVSSIDDSGAVVDAVRAGATGFVPKWAEPCEIVTALARVARGDHALHASVDLADMFAAVCSQQSREAAPAPTQPALTARELEVLSLLSEGLTSAKIANRLFLSRRTVECHLGNIYRKLGVHCQIEAVVSALAMNDEKSAGKAETSVA